MRKNMLCKFACTALVTVMTSISVIGCGSTAKSAVDENVGDGTKKELSYAMTTSSTWNDRYNTFAEIPLGQQLMKDTGVNLSMQHVQDKTGMNLLLASGELPDIIGFNFKLNYTGGEQKAINDGVIYGMTEDFVKKYAPNYWKVISADPDILKQVKTPEGNIVGFSFILGDELLKAGKGLIIRDDWCKELGISTPETPDEFEAMLKAFKEKKGCETPLSVSKDGLAEMMNLGMITTPFGLVTTDTYLDNGKVTIGYAQPEYKKVLEWLHKLYEEGLLDANFSTIDSKTVTANILTGKSGVAEGAAGSALGTWLDSSKDKDYSLAGIKGLVAKKGDIPMYTQWNNTVVGGVTSISATCDDKAAAAKFLDYGYTDAGNKLYNFGIEGESYTMQNGVPTYTDKILNNPDGLSTKQALSEYSLAYGNGPFVQDKEYLLQYYKHEEQKEALKQWSISDVKKYKMPTITIAAENSAEYSSIVSDISSYKEEMMIKFIRGTESLDNFDKYISTLKSMGIDRVVELQQAAVEEYNKR